MSALNIVYNAIGALLRYNVDMTSVACNKADLANRWSWDYSNGVYWIGFSRIKMSIGRK
jgi:hypothetical protein